MTKDQENKLIEQWHNVYHEHSEIIKLIVKIAEKYNDLDDAFSKLQNFYRKLNNVPTMPKAPRIQLVWMKED